MIKCKTEISKEMQQELNKTAKLIYKILMLVGIVGLIAYFFINEEAWWVELFLMFSVPFAIGLVLLITVKKLEKQIVDFEQANAYEFFDEYLTVETFKNDESVATAKLYYKDLKKVKQTENYVFLFIDKGSALPILKSGLQNEELDFILNTIPPQIKSKKR